MTEKSTSSGASPELGSEPVGAGLIAFNRSGSSTDLDVAFDYFAIESEGDPIPAGIGEPDLSIQAPKVVKVKPRQKLAKFPFRVRNSGDAASGPVRLCVNAPKRKLALKGKKCISTDIPAGEVGQRQVKLRVKPKARGKTTKVKLTARGPDIPAQTKVVRVQARR